MTSENPVNQTVPALEAFIRVTPPLPFILNEKFQGFVHEIGASGLRLVFSPATPILPMHLQMSPFHAHDLRGSDSEAAFHQLIVSREHGSLYRFDIASIQSTRNEPKASLLPTASDERIFYAQLAATGTSSRTLTDLLAVLRKNQHIQICQNEDVEASDRFTGFDQVSLLPRALPEFDWNEISIGCSFLGRRFAAPIFITGMTGGVDQGAEINRRLAVAAAAHGIPMGVGSQRIALENPEHARIFAVKNAAPNLFCIANIGAAQIMSDGALDDCRRAIDMIEADALAIHINVLQELVQVEGDRQFRGLIARIGRIAATLQRPVIVKEVGGGMDADTARELFAAGVSAVDVGGKGGTSWSHIEGLRSTSANVQSMSRVFRDWGIPTAYALSALRRAHPDRTITATGGIRDGLTVAKAVALGANMAGIGLPLFRAALESEEAPYHLLDAYIKQLKTAMMCSGAQTIDQLASRLVYGRPLESQFIPAPTVPRQDRNADQGSLLSDRQADQGSLLSDRQADQGSLLSDRQADQGSLASDRQADQGSLASDRHGAVRQNSPRERENLTHGL